MPRQDTDIMTKELIDDKFDRDVESIDIVVKGEDDNIPKRVNTVNTTKIIIEDSNNNSNKADIQYNTWDDFHNVKIFIVTGNEFRYGVKKELERIFKEHSTRSRGLIGGFDTLEFNEINMNGSRFSKYEIGYDITYNSYTSSIDDSTNQ